MYDKYITGVHKVESIMICPLIPDCDLKFWFKTRIKRTKNVLILQSIKKNYFNIIKAGATIEAKDFCA